MKLPSQKQIHALFEYKDGALYWRKATGKCAAGAKAGYVNTNGYVQVCIAGQRYYAHRLIFKLFNNEEPEFLDHMDGDRANNRYDNLRPATRSQNMHNRKRNTDNTSGVKGVSWAKRAKKWYAYGWVNNKQYNLGYYEDLSAAASAVHKFRKQNHGAYARM